MHVRIAQVYIMDTGRLEPGSTASRAATIMARLHPLRTVPLTLTIMARLHLLGSAPPTLTPTLA